METERTAVLGGEQVREATGVRCLLAGLAGLLAAAVSLGAAELVAGLIGPVSSPVVAVGQSVIALTPEPVKEFAIRTFGPHDKDALITGTLVLLALYALGLGVVALRDLRPGIAGIVLFGLLGAVAAITRPAGGPQAAVPSLVGALGGIVALRLLIAPLTRSPRDRTGAAPRDMAVPSAGASAASLPALLAAGDRKGNGMDRRHFFLTSAAAVGVAVATGGGGRLLQRRFDVADARKGVTLPRPSSPAAALPAGADLSGSVAGLTPLFTANPDFYRVDTALAVPQIRPSDYRLMLTGMFDRPRSYTFDDLLRRRDLIERDITLTCVSNEVGGRLAGTARWLGVPLGDFLRENGIRGSSTQLVCRSSDGMTIGAPTRSALEVNGAMLALGMNGEPLPVEHGFPVRMLIPGLYGYVSACKWLTRIEATTFEAFDPYWVQRNWARTAPIKIASRVDTPAALRRFPAGVRPIAGVAWAQTRGIGGVEVQVDDGPWMPARLSPANDVDLWRQWVLPFDFRPGTHSVTVRATSADGELQSDRRAAPFPDGASGWHSIQVIAT